MVEFISDGTITIRESNFTLDEQLCLTAVGDICMGDGIKRYLREKGPDSPFQHCQKELQKTDILFGNLEMVIYEDESHLLPSRLDMCAPASLCAGLAHVGFDILNLANNHILDFGPQAAEDTTNFLNQNKIGTIGYGRNTLEAWSPIVIEKKGYKAAFLACPMIGGRGQVKIVQAPLSAMKRWPYKNANLAH